MHADFYLSTWDTQDIAQEAVKKRRRATKKPYSRSIVGATLEVIQKKRSEKPEVRDAAREAALRCVFSFFFSYME
jgi:large subunit ribosomal protein L24e